MLDKGSIKVKNLIEHWKSDNGIESDTDGSKKYSITSKLLPKH